MMRASDILYIADTPLKQAAGPVRGEYVTLLGESFYRIGNYDLMEPFFMSIASSSDHWLFVASTGGLSAGRGDAESALFPYYTVDRLTENGENTGPKAILRATVTGRTHLWEPFSDRLRGCYAIRRNLYKNVSGTALVFEEINTDLGLVYRYAWRTSERFGFVKTTWLTNSGNAPCRVEIVDGLQNVLPANVASGTQNTFSALLDAYKRSELHAQTGLAIFSLSSTLTDLAEPSESLLATTAVQLGAAADTHLLSSAQLDHFRSGGDLDPETDVRGRRGAYFTRKALDLAPLETRTWHLLADVQQDSAAIVTLIDWLQGEPEALASEVEADIAANQLNLWKIVASADGAQLSENPLHAAHHFANVMFNVMRGGIFADQYRVRSVDFADFVKVRNRPVWQASAAFFEALPESLDISELCARAEAYGSADLVRLSSTYLPLVFSRRHGDPSRPWNRFAIRMKKPDGSIRLDYEGNWRDIFQNWEALAYSYPEFVEAMIATFLNATTVDGYNPYRITYRGVDWEVPEPNNPWANIGYWSDHQITYLHRLMDISTRFHPGKLQNLLARPLFSYANVPYRIKPYAALLREPRHTIDFDWAKEEAIQALQAERGTDGRLVCAPDGQLVRASLAEKLLTLLLAKLVNLVPEGGIWMNTQRPEWNDANNALVGKGLSVVTLCYLRQYLTFCGELFGNCAFESVPLHTEVYDFTIRVSAALERFQPMLAGPLSDDQRRVFMDALGEIGSEYRQHFYDDGLCGEQTQASIADILAFLESAQAYVDHSLRANRRADGLYHAYNILQLGEGTASIRPLYEMLEGQVAALSSGMLSADEALALLHTLRHSALYRADQRSYLLYPDRDLPGFLEKNCLTETQVLGIPLLAALVEAGDRSIITHDVRGTYHFSGKLRNVDGVDQALNVLTNHPIFAPYIEADRAAIRALFEETFRHDEFTGRSGTFFAYEGLGSVYWHMVAKLLLAVQETVLRFRNNPAGADLYACYDDIRQGLGLNKSPNAYGAFPTDPYSHTPKGQGAKQPGMTGLVKELVIARQAETGFTVVNGQLTFDAALVDAGELLAGPAVFSFVDVGGNVRRIGLEAGSLAYSVCQTPVVLRAAERKSVTVQYADGSTHEVDGDTLDKATSGHLFARDGAVSMLTVSTTFGG